jgi:hypothetical protein
MRGLRTIGVEESKLGGLACKTMNEAVESTRFGRLHGEDTPGKAALFMPSIDPEPAGTNFK